MLTYGGTTFTYTANGELLTKTDSTGTTTYTYDAMGSLIAVNLPNGTLIEYVTDGKYRRIGKMVNGVVTKQWLYHSQLKPVAELDGAGNLVAQFVYGTKGNVPDLVIRGGVNYRIISDQLGSPVLAINAASSTDIPFQATYLAFGARTLAGGADDWMPFGFAGGIFDPDTQLTRFGGRDYDAQSGRWISKDPIKSDGGDTNLYRYASLDPVNEKDISGLDTFMCTKPLHALGSFGQSVYGPAWYNPLYHQYVCVTDSSGVIVCGGQDRTGSAFFPGSPGKPSNDQWPMQGEQGSCQNVDDRKCVDNCMVGLINSPQRPWYAIGPQGTDCQEWAGDALASCQAQCQGQ